MSRFLTVRALGLAVVALVAMAAMVLLGRWQLGVFEGHRHSAAEAQVHQPAVPLDIVLRPDQAFTTAGVSRPVTVTGTYRPAEQIWVRGLPGSPDRYALATPLVTARGVAIFVVRGATSHLSAPSSPVGQVTVTGLLEPSRDSASAPDRARVTDGISVPVLVNHVAQDLYDGYVVLTRSSPAESPALAPVHPPLPQPSGWSGLRNLLYAVQWWVFAAFVVFMWWRMVTDGRPSSTDEAARQEAAGEANQPSASARNG
ncbi:MAG TPA: SURF1 family protein [Nocardioidaceae bacterium]|nr:SURF1 family protein [Nocardioidaceae bacterium]